MSEKARVTFYLEKEYVDAIKDWIKTEAPHHDVFSAIKFFIYQGLEQYGYRTAETVKLEGWLDTIPNYREGDSFVRPDPKSGPQLAQERLFLLKYRDELEQFQERFEAIMRCSKAEDKEE